MAVYTRISKENFQKILSDYNIGTFDNAIEIADGVENSNYLLKTSCGMYVSTIYERRMNEYDLPFFIELMEYLSDRGIRCPLPVHDNNNVSIRKISNRPFTIVTFLSGKWPKVINNFHCYEVGKALAKMHTATKDFHLIRNNDMSIDSWKKLLTKVESKLDGISAGMMNEVDSDLKYIINNWPDNLPKGIIHADLFPDNVLFEGKNLSGMIDFYNACSDFFAYDIAICLNAWCFEKNSDFNITKAKFMLKGYNSIKLLSEYELKALPILSCGAAMRFLLTRAYDWVNMVDGALVTPKNPIEYLHKIRFHMQVKSYTEYGL